MNTKTFWTPFALALAPVVSSWALLARTSGATAESARGLFALVVLALFSPLFFSIPALVTQHARDRALATVPNPKRAMLLLPYLITRRSSGAQVETAAALLGFAVAVMMLRGLAVEGIAQIW